MFTLALSQLTFVTLKEWGSFPAGGKNWGCLQEFLSSPDNLQLTGRFSLTSSTLFARNLANKKRNTSGDRTLRL
jgi:hypothetical protein